MDIVLVTLFLASCAPTPIGRYGESIDLALSESYTLDAVDHGIDLLVEYVGAMGVTDKVLGGGFEVRTVPDLEIGGRRYAGISDPTWLNGVTIRWAPGDCLGRSALLHEVTHLMLGWRGSVDADHAQLAWWVASDAASVEWAKEICK